MMKKLVLLLLLFSLIAAVLIASGVIHFRSAGVCFGLCEEKRINDFEAYFPSWLSRQGECPGRSIQDRQTLTSLLPDLAKRLDVKNKDFFALALKEEAGTISLGEQESYLSDPWRVIVKQEYLLSLGGIVMSPNLDTPIIRACNENGFVKGEYCEDYVSIPMKLPDPFYLSNYGPVVFGDRVYAHLRDSDKLDIMISQMKTDSWRSFDLRQLAKQKVLQMPVSSFPLKNSPLYESAIKNRQEEVYMALSCGKD